MLSYVRSSLSALLYSEKKIADINLPYRYSHGQCLCHVAWLLPHYYQVFTVLQTVLK